MMRIWLGVALATALASTSALAQLKIGVIASSTGATAVVGIPQKNTAALLPKKIGDLTVEYLVFDDASDATQTVIIVKKLLAEHKIDALIGPSGSPNSAMISRRADSMSSYSGSRQIMRFRTRFLRVAPDRSACWSRARARGIR